MEFLKLRIPCIFLFSLVCFFSFSQTKTVTYYADPASVPPELSVELKHLNAQVRFNPGENEVIATAEFTLLPNRFFTDSIVLYAPDFTIKTVEINHRKVSYKLSGKNLVIYPQEIPHPVTCHPELKKGVPAQLFIDYTAKPLAGAIYFIGWKPEEEGKRQEIWAHRPHGWLPYADARITTDFYITFDQNFKIFSNGERMEVKHNEDGTLTWHYAMKKDHPYFSTALVIGDYQYEESITSRGIPLEFWYYTGLSDRVSTTYKYTEQMFSFLEEETGVPYPYPVYREAPVIDYLYGAMETTTSTIFGDYMQITPRSWWQRNYVNVNAHELAHQWFGNYVAHFVNRDVWLTESFGTYYAKLFERSVYGNDYYQNIRNEEMLQVLEASKKNDFPVGGCQGGNQRIYQKGSLVLDMLKYVMEEKEFKHAIQRYLNKFGFNYAETNDFIRCVYEAGGKSFHWFFDEWVLRGGEPHYQVEYSVVADSLNNQTIQIHVQQLQEVTNLKGLFKMPVKLEIYYTDGSLDSTLAWVEKKEENIIIPNKAGKKIAFLLFDPGRKILKKLSFNRSYNELSAQLLGAKEMIDRYDALLELRSFSLKEKRALLMKAYTGEYFHLIKSEILSQLKDSDQHDRVEIFRSALKDPDANVRKTALLLWNPLPLSLKKEAENCLKDSSFLNVEIALDNLARSFPQSIPDYLKQTANEEGWRGKNIRMKWLEITILNGQKECLNELISYSGPKYEFETRMNAFNLLKKINYFDQQTMNNARSASQHWNNKLSAVAKEYLK